MDHVGLKAFLWVAGIVAGIGVVIFGLGFLITLWVFNLLDGMRDEAEEAGLPGSREVGPPASKVPEVRSG